MNRKILQSGLSMAFMFAYFITNAQKIENRTSIINYLQGKVEQNLPLVAHVLVPLCDNVHQGIIPTSPKIGDGLKPNSNLYWATSKGVKRYFSELSDWKLLKSIENPKENILERVVFFKKFPNGAQVYLIADAYRGDKMPQCLNDYFNSLSKYLKDSITIDKITIPLNGGADLIAFNEHNGLMDESTQFQKATSQTRPKDAVSISCVSNSYFKPYYEQTKSFPLVHTTHLLYPGAFILEGILNEWAMLKSLKECKIAAGKGYYKHKPKSGPNGSQNLFDFGWSN